MKKLKKLLSLSLVFAMIFSVAIPASASDVTFSDNEIVSTNANNSIVVTDNGIYINGIFYTPAEFSELLDTAIEVETLQPASAAAGALIAGTWMIPGVGEVIITAAGAVIVAGVVYAAGSWIYDTVTNWFATRAFNQSAEDAVNNCDSNKQNHIMQSKHNWNKFNKDPKWSDVAPILIKVLKDGSETWEKNSQYIRTLVYKGETVVVRFIKDADGLVKYISTAWCE